MGGISPMEERHRRWLDGFEWTPALREDYARRAHAVYEHLSGQLGIGEATGPGPCDECRTTAPVRVRLGRFELCLSCNRRRHSVAVQLAEEFAA